MWANHSWCWQGTLTQAYSKSSEEAQRSQRREGPANLMRNFRDRALGSSSTAREIWGYGPSERRKKE